MMEIEIGSGLFLYSFALFLHTSVTSLLHLRRNIFVVAKWEMGNANAIARNTSGFYIRSNPNQNEIASIVYPCWCIRNDKEIKPALRATRRGQ